MMDLENLKQSLVSEWSNIHPELFTSHHPDRYYSDILDSIITAHPHVRAVTHFADTQIFQHLIKDIEIENGLPREEIIKKYDVIKERLIEVDKVIKDINYEDLTPNDILPYIDILAHHIISEGFEPNNKIRYLTRFGSHRIHRPEIQQKMLQVLDDMHAVYINQDDPETGGYRTTSTWHDVMTCVWAFIEGGFIEHTKFVLDTLTDLTEKIQSLQPTNRVFELWDLRGKSTSMNYSKHLRSTYSASGPFYGAIGETEKAIKIYKKSIDLFNNIPGYTERTRIVEHAIELYKLDPTEENKLLVKKLFVEYKTNTPHESFETVREAGVIALMLLQDIFGVSIS
jgi:hypothetical protein